MRAKVGIFADDRCVNIFILIIKQSAGSGEVDVVGTDDLREKDPAVARCYHGKVANWEKDKGT